MKTSIIIGLLVFILFSSFPAYSQDVFIYGKNGTKEYFEKADSIVRIKFKEGISSDENVLLSGL
jgi:hypothetical protein